MKSKKHRASGVVAIGGMYVDINFPDVPLIPAQWKPDQDIVMPRYDMALGGSATIFSKIAAELGLASHLIAKVGDDYTALVIRRLLMETRIIPHLIVDPRAQTTVAINMIDRHGDMYGVAVGVAGKRLRAQEVEPLAHRALRQCAYLYIGSLFKMTHLLPLYIRLARYAQSRGVQVVLDHGRINSQVTTTDIKQMKRLLPHVDLYLPSEQEFQEVWNGRTLAQAVSEMRKVYSGITVVTRGKAGAVGFVSGARIRVPGFPVTVNHPVGAGDSFNAGLLWGLSHGQSLSEAIRSACAVAALKISKSGVVTSVAAARFLRQ